ncbi:splA/ryanodine receptor domain and SOCS box containing gustavus isoform X1 [Rhynchophorus ferrugineus]|uniref:splA/ryanodine receptor domain and SOCS box containing gustavus isoform X1 n=1 Tax=Rhynchophorus ferrugineus TaxID=354439 RepID=UPI003FCDEFFC
MLTSPLQIPTGPVFCNPHPTSIRNNFHPSDIALGAVVVRPPPGRQLAANFHPVLVYGTIRSGASVGSAGCLPPSRLQCVQVVSCAGASKGAHTVSGSSLAVLPTSPAGHYLYVSCWGLGRQFLWIPVVAPSRSSSSCKVQRGPQYPYSLAGQGQFCTGGQYLRNGSRRGVGAPGSAGDMETRFKTSIRTSGVRNVGCSGGGGQQAAGVVRGAADVRRAYKASVVPACGGAKAGTRGRRGARGMSMGQKVSGGVKAVNGRDAAAAPYKPVIPRELAQDFAKPARLDMLLDMPPALRETQLKYSWNQDDRSLNIFVKEDDKLTFHRHPVAQSTDCIRGKVGFTKGMHCWEVCWSTRQRGTHAVVGVATAEAPLHSVGYQSLVGSTDNSWGWDLGRNKLYHDSKNQSGVLYPALLKPDETFIVPDKFLVVLDMDEGTLSFVVDGQYLGVAFRGLKGLKLYPIVSAVWGHCEITMRYIGGLDPEPLPLMDLCRRVIRQKLGKAHLEEKVMGLQLPQALQTYLLYKDRR